MNKTARSIARAAARQATRSRPRSGKRPGRSKGRGRGLRSWGSLAVLFAFLAAWAIERHGPGLLPEAWYGLFDTAPTDCRLDRVIDGDSLRLICGGERVEVRMHCIDAPEGRQKPWGDESRRHLERLATPRLELVTIETDRYGRTVGQVFTTGAERTLLNLEQVRQGQAAVYPQYCEDGRFYRAEREAKKAKRGIWRQPGDHQRPWVYRQQQR